MSETQVRPVRHVVLVGRDEALWLTTNVLQKAFARSPITFSVVEMPSQLRPGEVLAAPGSQAGFHAQLGIEDEGFLPAIGAAYGLGQRFVGWGKTAPPFFLGHSTTGSPVNNVPFHHLWLRARGAGMNVPYEDFSISVACAKQGRLLTDQAELTGFAEVERSYFLPSVPYCDMLRQLATRRGVKHITTSQVYPIVEAGQMSAVVLSNGDNVEGDLFIDATGSEARLLTQMNETRFESWRQWLPFDRLLTCYAAPATPLPTFAQVSAFRSGWLGLFPLRHYTALQQVYRHQDLSDDEAYENAAIISKMKIASEATVSPFEAGQRQAWSGNVIGVGDAAAVFDPLNSARMTALLFSISHLTALFPLDTRCAERTVYNHTLNQIFTRLRDSQILLYTLNKRRDQPVWDYMRNVSLPPSLAYKLELFEARGHMPMYDEDAFDESWWVAACLAQGVTPRAYDPNADHIEETELIRHFQNVLGYIRKQVEGMPTPDAYFARAVS